MYGECRSLLKITRVDVEFFSEELFQMSRLDPILQFVLMSSGNSFEEQAGMPVLATEKSNRPVAKRFRFVGR
jgi:hypothetical protein